MAEKIILKFKRKKQKVKNHIKINYFDGKERREDGV